MKKLAFAAFGGAALGLVVTTQVAGPLLAQEAGNDRSIYEQLDLFGDIFERIRADYVEEVEEQDLIEAAINGMLTSLDPHSSYLSPEDAEKMRVQTRGEFGASASRSRRKRAGSRSSRRWTAPPPTSRGSPPATSSPMSTARA